MFPGQPLNHQESPAGHSSESPGDQRRVAVGDAAPALGPHDWAQQPARASRLIASSDGVGWGQRKNCVF